MLEVVATQNGWGISTTTAIKCGVQVLEDKPFLVCPTSFVGLLARFLSLSNEELEFLSTLHSNEANLKDESEILKILPRESEHWSGFRWFWCILKCNAHFLKEGLNVWGIYKHAVRINHSCAPNITACNVNGVLRYTSIRDIEAGEELCASYMSDLFAPKAYRQRRLLRDRLFVCRCSRCISSTEDSYRVFHCPLNCQPGAVVILDSSTDSANPWKCKDCSMSFPANVVPLALESTLEDGYTSLVLANMASNPMAWIHKAMYLYQTCRLSLPAKHWIQIGCYRLFSKFYVGVYEGFDLACTNEEQINILNLAFQHSMNFLLLASEASEETVMIDVAPLAFQMMKLAIKTESWDIFRQLAVRFHIPCKILFGANEPWIRRFEDSLELMAQGKKLRWASQRVSGR
eukprot:Gregarina_sp_Poly_1__1593@NODE_1402_length_4216_cov_283_219330_g933_i0_p1_GENE_NODE_1402_length_4216_cov_283_219330_g933_i0NODE_1402_length_4216_cov_283_219330_g933_i0_p1_ORF_typecomplete_len403_score39_68SET/PF00856_28/5_3e12SET/PF00856_28/3_1e03_NODE_1402_length_4216_cov_283_219330_g933_i022033411